MPTKTRTPTPTNFLARFFLLPVCLASEKMQHESKDPAIKLFGKEIAVPADGDTPLVEVPSPTAMDECSRKTEEFQDSSATESIQQDDMNPSEMDESENLEECPESTVKPKTPSIDDEAENTKAAKSDKSQNDASNSNSQEKVLKKPDKILPCPRCNSMDTKFCYYNNYNVNQPRHFCKACQRYWTAGGTMRNVPVGAGRRKNKNSASQYRHITISEALQAAWVDAPNGITHPNLKSNGRVLSFGIGTPTCDSMSSVLNLAERKVLNGTRNGFQEQEIPVPCRDGENGDVCSSGSSIAASNPVDVGGRNGVQEPLNGFPSPVPCLPCLPGVTWPYQWNAALPPPALCPSTFPMPFYPAAFWNCGIPGTWNMPWLSPQSSANQKSPSSWPNSPTLGKHSRDTDMIKPDNMDRDDLPKEKNGCVLVPKTLRIDDPNEAAKSSIWATLGIKNESIVGGGLFKGLQSKSDEKIGMAETSPAMRANPAALSRSLNFHEST